MAQPPPDSSEALLKRLLAAADALRQVLANHFKSFGLNESRVGVLRLLRSQGAEGCSQTELAKRLKLSESSVCGLVDRMQSDGLIFRFRSRQDRRRSLLMLSEKGAQLVNDLEAGRRRSIERTFECFSPSEKRLLAQLLSRMNNHDVSFDPASAYRKEAG